MNMLTAAAQGRRIDYIYDAAANDDRLSPFATIPSERFDCDGFIAGACEFFATRAKQSATVGTPYVAHEDQIAALEFTATIRLTGNRRGAVYVTASRAMLTILLMRMGATDITVAAMTNVLRELASAMANAVRANRDDVLVWDPSIATDRAGRIACDAGASPVIVPVHWRKFTAQLVMCVE